MNIENSIEVHYRKLSDTLSNEYEDLYDSVDNSRLKTLFSTLHAQLVNLFDTMNDRLPTLDGTTAHFWAEPSRELIETIGIIEALQRSLKNSQFAFTLDEYYGQTVSECKDFLSRSGGSTIPSNIPKIELYYKIPIFLSRNSIVIDNQKSVSNLQ